MHAQRGRGYKLTGTVRVGQAHLHLRARMHAQRGRGYKLVETVGVGQAGV